MSRDPSAQTVSLPGLLRHARGAYARAMREALEQDGHEPIPANGLYVIGRLAWEAGSVPIGRLVVELGITKQGAGQLVDLLVTRGYLTRTPDEKDRRQLLVSLTERGHAAAQTQARAREAVDAALVSIVGSADAEITRRTLAGLVDLGRPDASLMVAETASSNQAKGDLTMSADRFENRRMDGAVFHDCSLAGAQFDDINLAEAVFSDVNLRRAHLSNINLSDVVIENANIAGLTIMGHDITRLIAEREASQV